MAVGNMQAPGAADLEGLTAWIQGGVTTIPRDAAIQELDRWHQRLAHSGRPELQPIAGRLESLRTALAQDPPDATVVGDLLVALGADITGLAAVEGQPGLSQELDELAYALEGEGVALTGRAAEDAPVARRRVRDINSLDPGSMDPALRGV